jgi:hypothetical protein
MEDNIKIDFRKIEREDVDWIKRSRDGFQWRAFMNMVMILLVP